MILFYRKIDFFKFFYKVKNTDSQKNNENKI